MHQHLEPAMPPHIAALLSAPSAESSQAVLDSVAASIDLALHQLTHNRLASAVEILAEAAREARGEAILAH